MAVWEEIALLVKELWPKNIPNQEKLGAWSNQSSNTKDKIVFPLICIKIDWNFLCPQAQIKQLGMRTTPETGQYHVIPIDKEIKPVKTKHQGKTVKITHEIKNGEEMPAYT